MCARGQVVNDYLQQELLLNRMHGHNTSRTGPVHSLPNHSVWCYSKEVETRKMAAYSRPLIAYQR